MSAWDSDVAEWEKPDTALNLYQKVLDGTGLSPTAQGALAELRHRASDLGRVLDSLAAMIEVFDHHDEWCGHNKDAPGWSWADKVDKARRELARHRPQEEGPEVVVHHDKYGVWTMMPTDDVPVLRYPTTENAGLSEYALVHEKARSMIEDCTGKKDCPAEYHMRPCKAARRSRRLGG